MMRVLPQPEPKGQGFDFHAKVRVPGRRLLMELRGDKNAPKRSGRKRSPVAVITQELLTEYWTLALPTLAECYADVCAYCCVRIDPETGSRTVDHFKPKHAHPDAAYEWDNFRYATLTMNRRKGIDETLCDPFQVGDDWFLLDLVTFGLDPHPSLAKGSPVRAQVQHTIDTLELDREPMRNRRKAAWDIYADTPTPYTWWWMARDCPLVARQYVRQRGGPPDEALPLYTPPARR